MTKHLFVCLFAICVSSSVKCLNLCPHYKELEYFLLLHWDFFIYFGYKPCISYVVQVSSPRTHAWCQLDPSRGVWLSSHCPHLQTLLHPWLPYFSADIVCSTDSAVRATLTKQSAGFGRECVLDSGKERWTRKGLFVTCSWKQCLCQQRRRCCCYFSSVYADSFPLLASALIGAGAGGRWGEAGRVSFLTSEAVTEEALDAQGCDYVLSHRARTAHGRERDTARGSETGGAVVWRSAL